MIEQHFRKAYPTFDAKDEKGNPMQQDADEFVGRLLESLDAKLR